jgi:hypothetical protein
MEAIAKAEKRKDLMDNIKARLNSNNYNVTRHFRKNEKDLREKVKFFEKKIATGEMREYMMPRFQQAQALLAKIEGLRPANMPAVPKVVRAPRAPKAVAVPLAGPAAVPLAVPAPVEPILAPNRPIAADAMVDVPLTIRIPKTRGRTAKANSGVARATQAKATQAKATQAKATRAKKTVKIRNTVNVAPRATRGRAEVVENEFLQQAVEEVLPLPELYDPYTGRKYAPEESPMEDIERAYFMLKKIRADTWRRAATLRKRSMKKTAAATAAVNTGFV